MSTNSEEVYSLPLFEIDHDSNTMEFIAETGEDAESSPNRIEIEVTDHGQQNVVLRVKEYSYGTCISRERFKVTNPQRRICSYQDGTLDDLDVDILWAVYLSGFAIENLDSYSQNFIDVKETLAFVGQLRDYEDEYADVPLVRRTIRDLQDIISGIVQLLIIRHILGVDPYRDAFTRFERERLGIAEDDVLDDEVTSYAMRAYDFATTVAEEYDVDERFAEDVHANEEGEFADPVQFSLIEHEEQGTTYRHVVVLTERGAARYDFQRTGEQRCVYQRRRTDGRPIPEALQLIERDDPGWRVSNVGTTLTAESLDEVLATGMDVVEDLRDYYRDDGVWSMDLLCAKAMRQIGSVRFMRDVSETIGKERFGDVYRTFCERNNLPEDTDLQISSHELLRSMLPAFSTAETEAVQALRDNNTRYDENHEPLRLS